MQWTVGLLENQKKVGVKEGMLKEIGKEDFMVEKEGEKEFNTRNKERNEPTGRKKAYMGKFLKSIVDFADSVFVAMVKVRICKKNTEAIIMAAQNQTWMSNIGGVDCTCYSVDESSMHMANGCKQLAKRHYMIRHNLFTIRVYWELCRKH